MHNGNENVNNRIHYSHALACKDICHSPMKTIRKSSDALQSILGIIRWLLIIYFFLSLGRWDLLLHANPCSRHIWAHLTTCEKPKYQTVCSSLCYGCETNGVRRHGLNVLKRRKTIGWNVSPFHASWVKNSEIPINPAEILYMLSIPQYFVSILGLRKRLTDSIVFNLNACEIFSWKFFFLYQSATCRNRLQYLEKYNFDFSYYIYSI